MFLSNVIHPYDLVILVNFKYLFQFPVNAAYLLFRDFFFMQFSVTECAGYKIIYVCVQPIYKEKQKRRVEEGLPMLHRNSEISLGGNISQCTKTD